MLLWLMVRISKGVVQGWHLKLELGVVVTLAAGPFVVLVDILPITARHWLTCSNRSLLLWSLILTDSLIQVHKSLLA